MTYAFLGTKWRGMTVTWERPNRLIKHPKDVTRKQRQGHYTIARFGGTHEAITKQLSFRPRNAPCPFIVRVPFFGDHDDTIPFEKGKTWLDTVGHGSGDAQVFIANLKHLAGFMESEIPKSCLAWRLQWFSWDLPTQVKKPPAFLFAFEHRNVDYDLNKSLDNLAREERERRRTRRW